MPDFFGSRFCSEQVFCTLIVIGFLGTDSMSRRILSLFSFKGLVWFMFLQRCESCSKLLLQGYFYRASCTSSGSVHVTSLTTPSYSHTLTDVESTTLLPNPWWAHLNQTSDIFAEMWKRRISTIDFRVGVECVWWGWEQKTPWKHRSSFVSRESIHIKSW